MYYTLFVPRGGGRCPPLAEPRGGIFKSRWGIVKFTRKTTSAKRLQALPKNSKFRSIYSYCPPQVKILNINDVFSLKWASCMQKLQNFTCISLLWTHNRRKIWYVIHILHSESPPQAKIFRLYRHIFSKVSHQGGADAPPWLRQGGAFWIQGGAMPPLRGGCVVLCTHVIALKNFEFLA